MTCPYVCPNKCSGLSGYLIQPTMVDNPILSIIGEAPGEDEVKQRRFFVGKAGQELSNYLYRVGIPRERCHISNVIKCNPPGNRNPKEEEVANCCGVLLDELSTVRPRFIASVGRFATQFFLGDVNMETVHGIPYRITHPVPAVVIPVYHPSAGLHDTTFMSHVMMDFISIKQAMERKIPIRNVGVTTTPPPYTLVKDPAILEYALEGEKVVAIDTETQDDWYTPWSLQICTRPEMGGCVVLAEDAHLVQIVAKHLANPEVLTIIHNSLFDLSLLRNMQVYPARITDTMIMAYLLQTEPQGLKSLAYRHLNVRMDEYNEVVTPRTQEMAIEYLVKAAGFDWGKLPPVYEVKAGKPKVRQPQPINQKIERILKDVAEGKEVDVYERWHKTPLLDGRGMVEQRLGAMRKAYLKDVVPIEKAYQYAATDAWATTQVFPILAKKIQALELQDVLDRDIGIIPMVETMQRVGMHVDPVYFAELKRAFTEEMDEVNARITSLVGDVHPGSDPQVMKLLENLKLINVKRKMVNGKEVVVRKKATDIAAMELIKDKHPVVPEIMRWRSLSKLVDSFIDVLLEKKGEDDRIRTTLRVTRVVTGRLASSNPNLMAQPTRSEDGRKIRGGFTAPEGKVLISGDQSQVEMRVVAHISGDEKMIDVFCSGKDIHAFTASGMFGLPIDQLDEMKHRYPAKRVGFGILNMISAKKLLKEMSVGGAEGWTEVKCQKMIDDWFALYTGVADYVEDRKSEARRTGMVRDMFGRIRLVPEVLSVHPQIVEAGIRQSVNAPIQMGAQGIEKECMRQLVPLYQSFGENAVTPLIQIHDDILWEVDEDLVETFIPMAKEIMENCVKLSVPLKVDFKWGKDWEHMTKWKGGK